MHAEPPFAHHSAPSSRRIALFTGAYNHIADGVSLTLNRLVSYLERQGAVVRVFAPTVDDPPVDHAGTLVPIPSISAPGRSEYRVSMWLPRSVRKQLDAFRPTLFHIATPDLMGRHALHLARERNVPAVASYHTHFSSYLKYYGLHLLEGAIWAYLRRFYRQCRHVYVPSPSMAAVLREHGITQGLRLWERGVDMSRFNPTRRSMDWRRAHGIQDEEVVVTFVSRLVWEKGLDVFADVIEQLNARGVPHRSMVVGDGPARDDLAERLPNTLFTGHLEDEKLACAYASSDVFLFPSDTETFGNVTLEAMASGLPTVCADATGSATLVNHGETGFLAPAGQASRFSEYVEQLLKDDDLRRRMGWQAARRARPYEWDAVMGRLMGYYDEILQPASAGGDGTSSAPPRRLSAPAPSRFL